MPYVMEQHGDQWTSVSDLGAIEVVPKSTTMYKVPEGVSLPMRGLFGPAWQSVKFEQFANFNLNTNAFVDSTTGKLEDKVTGRLASRTVVRLQGTLINITNYQDKAYDIELPKGFQLKQPSAVRPPTSSAIPETTVSGGITYYRIQENFERYMHKPQVRITAGPVVAVYVVAEDLTAAERAMHGLPPLPATPPQPPQPRPPVTAPRPTVGDPVRTFQQLVGAGVDGKYGKESHRKGHTWAKENAQPKAASFKRNGPIAIEIELLRKLPGLDIDALQAAYKQWTRNQISSPPPVEVTPEISQEVNQERMQAWQDVQRAGFGLWFQDNWWILAAVVAVGIGGYFVWKRHKGSGEPLLPEGN